MKSPIVTSNIEDQRIANIRRQIASTESILLGWLYRDRLAELTRQQRDTEAGA